MNPHLDKKYLVAVLLIALVYLVFVTFISGFSNTIILLTKYAATVNWLKLIISFILSLAIAVLVGLNAVYLYKTYKQRKECRSAKALTSVGAAAGVIVGICPLCVTGLVPILLSFVGISFSFAALPLQGIEVQGITVIILAYSLYIIKRK